MKLDEVKTKISASEKLIADLYLPNCIPCKNMKEKVFTQFENIPVLYIDCSEDEDVFNFFVESCGSNIVGVPCILLYENGKFVKRKDGYMSIEDLNKFAGLE